MVGNGYIVSDWPCLRYNSGSRSKSDSLRARRQRVTVSDFDLLKVIGRGAFGEVRLCRERSSSPIGGLG